MLRGSYECSLCSVIQPATTKSAMTSQARFIKSGLRQATLPKPISVRYRGRLAVPRYASQYRAWLIRLVEEKGLESFLNVFEVVKMVGK